jgi:hypothetical protein
VSPRIGKGTLMERMHEIKTAYFIEGALTRNEYIDLVDEWWRLVRVHGYAHSPRAAERRGWANRNANRNGPTEDVAK